MYPGVSIHFYKVIELTSLVKLLDLKIDQRFLIQFTIIVITQGLLH